MLAPELLREIPLGDAGKYLLDPAYGVEEKYNGHRRMFFKDSLGVRSLNKKGEQRTVPAAIQRVLGRVGVSTFAVDAEMLSDSVVLFDALAVGNANLLDRGATYLERYTRLTALAAPGVVVAPLARSSHDKEALVTSLIQNGAEGAVIRRLDALYQPGDSGQHFKLKFTKNLDAVVIGPSKKGHRSVDLGLFDPKGILRRICGASLLGKGLFRPGDVVEIRYLYATKDGHVVQPTILLKRDDRLPEECRTDQLQRYGESIS